MKYKTKNIFAIIGMLFIILGLLSLSIYKKYEKDFIEENGIVKKISTSGMIGEDIDNSKYPFYKNSDKYNETYIKGCDTDLKNKYIFYYPNDLNEDSLNDKEKHIVGKDIYIDTLFVDDYTIESYKKDFFDQLDTEDILLQVYDHNDKIDISSYDAYYYKVNYLKKIMDENGNSQDYYVEKFVIQIQESENSLLTIIITSTNVKLSDEFLTQFVNRIKIEKNAASYSYGTIVDDKIKGSIKQKNNINNNEYVIKYELPTNKYKELPLYDNNIFKTRFIEDKSSDYFDIEIVSDNSSNFLEEYKDLLSLQYSNSVPNKLGINETIYDGVTYRKISFSYFDELDNLTYKKLYLIRELENGVYYIVTYTTLGDISDETIKDFLKIDFTIEE